MNKNKNSKIMLILSILLLFIVIGTATAADDTISNETVSTTTNEGVDTLNTDSASVDEKASATATDNIIGSNDAEKLNLNNDNLLSQQNDNLSFNEFNKLIKSYDAGSTIELTNNIAYTTGDSDIVIDKPITIDGKNLYSINFYNSTGSSLKVTANNVILKNINLTNSYKDYGIYRFIDWTGNDGQILNSEFNNFTGLSWTGSNGIIKNSLFTNLEGVIQSTTGVPTTSGTYSVRNGFKFLNCNFTNINYKYTGVIMLNDAEMDNCIIHSITYTRGYNTITFIRTDGKVTIKNTDFYDIVSGSDAFIHSASVGMSLEYCNFTDITTGGSVFGGEAAVQFIDHCEFKNIKGNAIGRGNPGYLCGSSTVSYCTFINVTNPVTLNGANGNPKNDIVLKNLNFINNTYSINVGSYADNVLCENLYFNNNTNPVSINYGTKFVARNMNFTNTPSSYDISFIDTIKVNLTGMHYDKGMKGNPGNFSAYTELWVSNQSEDGASGLSNKTPCSLEYALDNIFSNGIIHIMDGVYTLNQQKNLISNMEAVNPGKVTINDMGLYITGPYTVSGITFNNTQFTFSLNQATKLSNCNFTNNKLTCTIGFVSGGKNDIIDNCTFININNTRFISDNTNAGGLEFINTKFINCNLTKFLENKFNNREYYPDGWKFNYVDFIGGELTNFISAYSLNHIRLSNYNNITFKDIVLGNLFNQYVQGASISNITISNCVKVGNSNLFELTDAARFCNVTIDGLYGNDEYVVFKNTGDINLYNITLKNLNASSLIDIKGSGIFELIHVNNVNANNAFNTIEVNSKLSKLVFTDSNFTNFIMNLLDGCILLDSAFTGVNGSVILNGDDIHLTSVNFTKCISSMDNGTVILNASRIFVQYCNFTNNMASENGGALYINGTGNNVMNSYFKGNNVTNGHGGAIFIISGVTCYIDQETSNTISLDDQRNGLWDKGRVPNYYIVYVNSRYTHDEMLANGSLVNTLSDAFNKINPNGRIVFTNASDVIFNMSAGQILPKFGITIEGNNTMLNVSGFMTISEYAYNTTIKNVIFLNSPDHVFVWKGDNGNITGCTFQNNGGKDSLYGSCIDVESPNLNIINTRFINNEVSNNDAIGGGALYVNNTNLVLKNCTFESNSANTGSHIYITSDSDKITIINSNINKGKPVSTGGSAIVFYNKVGTLSITNTNFTDNSAVNGGAIYSTGSLTIDGANFTDNSAVNGGAIYSTGSLIIVDANFTRNVASGNGGAIYSTGSLSIDGANFTDNSALNGGALYLMGSSNGLNNVILTGNRASVEGSALYLVDNRAVELCNVSVANNIHEDGHVDVYIGDGSVLSIPNNDFILGQDPVQLIRLPDNSLDVVYVNTTSSGGHGLGLTESDPLNDFSKAVSLVKDGGNIIVLGNLNINDLITFMSKTVTVTGNAHTISRKDKSLFNNRLTHIKSCS